MKRYIFEEITYVRTRKDIAKKRILAGKRFFLVGSNVNTFHFHEGWYLATHSFHKSDYSEYNYDMASDFINDLYDNFALNLEKELGRYPVFYVEV